MPRLIACDLDGTLLQNGAQQLLPETCDLIRQLSEKGVLFVAASGRQYTNLQRLFRPVKDEIGYLCENGCIAFYQGERLFKKVLDRELGQKLMKAILDTPGAEVLLSGEQVSYLQPKDPGYYLHMRDVVKNDVVLVADILKTEEDYIKVSIYEENGIRDEEIWKSRFGDCCTVVSGGADWLDIMPENVNKGTGLCRMLKCLGIDPKDCMAIGDNDNDKEMLQLVGIPVAVRNAKQEIRQLAKMETDTVENLLRMLLSDTAARE